MMNIIRNTTAFALHIAGAYIPNQTPEDSTFTVVDATCGNGHDTLALAEMLNPSETRKLYAFDIQQSAIHNTLKLLQDNGYAKPIGTGWIKVVCDSHENLEAHLDHINLIVFNLGYLPGGDKSITTCCEGTLRTINRALELLAVDGLICITMYSGHEAGAKEKAELLRFAEKLDSRSFHVSYISMANQHRNPPEILLITRKI